MQTKDEYGIFNSVSKTALSISRISQLSSQGSKVFFDPGRSQKEFRCVRGRPVNR